jgi:hypothetical protein
MDRKKALLGLLAGLATAASATLAFAGDWGGHGGWRTERCGCVVHVRHVRRVHHVRYEEHVRYVPVPVYVPLPPPPPPFIERRVEVEDEGVRLSNGFFADGGGVGGFVDYGGGGGGGGFVIAQGGAGAFAGARASASATISIGFRGGGHMGMHGHGCGCGGGGGHKW